MSLEFSLLDTAGMKVREWYVVYHDREPYFWFTKLLKRGYRHVELARALQYGPAVSDVAWIYLLPTFEMLDVELCTDPQPPWMKCPQSVCQKVVAARPFCSVRSWFDIGPPTCVETVKQALGIHAFWVRTPYQLFRYIKKRNGAIVSGDRKHI